MKLAEASTTSSSAILQTLAETILEGADCDAAAVSLLTNAGGQRRRYWPAVAGVKLMTTLTLVVYNLHQPGQVLPAIRDLGARHVGYGVKAADYDALKQALIWTLEQTLGEDCTPTVRDAWTVCYDELAHEMQAGAAGR